MRLGPRLSVLVLMLLLLVSPCIAGADETSLPTPVPLPDLPTQPLSGPGGNAPRYDGLLAQHFGPDPASATAPTGYWLFEPTRPRPGVPPLADTRLPLVLFLHAFRSGDPEIYHPWINHLVRRGAIVIFPDYQSSDMTAETTIAEIGQEAPTLIRSALRDALTELVSGDHAQPDLTRVAVVGHSLGAVLAADYTGTAASEGLPIPTALLLAAPGCRACDLSAVTGVPPTTRVLVVAGDETDETVATMLWAQMSAVPLTNRDYVRLRSDAHGDPPLEADHAQPVAGMGGSVDALDWYGTWKWLDALMACAFVGEWCEYALGDTPEQRFMGTWSDGVPVREAIVTDVPAALDAARGAATDP